MGWEGLARIDVEKSSSHHQFGTMSLELWGGEHYRKDMKRSTTIFGGKPV